MTVLYDREAFVFVDDRRIEGLRLKFKADKSLKSDPNTLDLHVFNLSAETRAGMKTRGAQVILVAGYRGDSEIVFSGGARTVDHVRTGAEWDTHIQCGDGEIAYRTSLSSFSFGPGTKWKDVVGRLSGDLKVKAGDALAKVKKGDLNGSIDTFLQGYTANGPTVREIDRVMKAAGLEWSIQDGKLQILRPAKATEETVIVLSPTSGLIGSPDHGTPEKDKGVPVLKARSLLRGGLRPGRSMKIESAAIRGFYRIEKVTHEGDTHGPEWYSSVEGTGL